MNFAFMLSTGTANRKKLKTMKNETNTDTKADQRTLQTAYADGTTVEFDTSIEEARWLFISVAGMAIIVFGSGFLAALIGA